MPPPRGGQRAAGWGSGLGSPAEPWDDVRDRPSGAPLELVNFILIFCAGWLVWRRPERERTAFALLVASALLMALVFFVGSRGSVLPGLNY
ncbi:MAG: hypothetical protein H6Q03_694 [Acidobacteria bacterium]|nr:hypothetical protein [Acidobacteriota bacterium]